MSEVIVRSDGTLLWNNKQFHCALGKNGVTQNKKEGDLTTPIGCFHLRKILYRKDRISRPKTFLPVSEIKPNDGWCDDVNSKEFYNRQIKIPSHLSYENLWREDEVYNLIIILGYNDNPPILGKGSAIFMHIARKNYSPTAGCIALSLKDLLLLLQEWKRDTQINIKKNIKKL